MSQTSLNLQRMCLLQEVIITEMGFAKDEYIQLQDECPQGTSPVTVCTSPQQNHFRDNNFL